MDRKPPFALKRKLEPTTTFPRPKRPDTSAALWPCFLSPACIPPHPDNEAFELLEPIVVKDSKVLHLGCRDGALTFAIARVVRPEGHVVGVNYPGEHVDATQRLSEALRKEEDISNVSFVQVADFTKLPFATEAFDVVYACDVMARLPPSPNYANALQLLVEMERVVKPFGFIVSRDIAAMHFFPETDLGSLITRTLFRATGLHGWYGPQMPKLFQQLGFTLTHLGTSTSRRGPALNQSFWAAAYAFELRPGSETRARWMAAGVLEQTIDLIIEKLQDWGRIPHS